MIHPRLLSVLVAAILLLGSAVSDGTAHAGPSTVLVFYANETVAEGPNLDSFNTIIGWLRAANTEKTTKVAGQLARDLAVFPTEVDASVGALEAGTAAGSSSLVIFTNRATLGGYCLVQGPGDQHLHRIPFKVPPSSIHSLTYAPLATADALAQALAVAASLFPPVRHEFILITKSHGSEELAMTPRLRVWAADTSAPVILKLVNDETTDRPVPHVGTTKEAYLSVLENAGTSLGMRFPTVYMGSCHSGLTVGQEELIPRNVGVVYVNDGGAEYSDVNYAAMFARVRQGAGLSDALPASIDGKDLKACRRPSFGRLHRVAALGTFYFPLVLCAGWWFARIRPRSHRRPPGGPEVTPAESV